MASKSKAKSSAKTKGTVRAKTISKPATSGLPKAKKEPAFSFIIEELLSSKIGKSVTVKPMFGAHAIYRGDQILFILRRKADAATSQDNGMWVVSSGVDTDGLKDEFKSLRAIKMFEEKKGAGIGSWINLPEDSPTFESDALSLAQLATRLDPRVGKVPGSKKKKPSASR